MGDLFQEFTLEFIIVIVCIAITIGLVVEKRPQAAVPAKQTSQQPQQASPAVQCQHKMEEWRQWLERVTANDFSNTGEQWRGQGGKPTLQNWITYCSREIPGWTVPTPVQTLLTSLERRLDEQRRLAEQHKANVTAVTQPQTQQAARTTEMYQSQCSSKMDELRLQSAKYAATANQPQRVAHYQEWRYWVTYCSEHIPGWQPPFIVSAQ